MQFHAGNRHFIAGAQQGAGGGKTFAAARTQVVHAQVDGSHTGKPLAQLFFVDGVMAGKGTADADQASGNVQRGGDHPAMQDALRPVADHHRLIIKAKLGKRFFVAFQFETEGAVKRHVIDENLPYQFQGCFGSKFRHNTGSIR